MPDDETSGYPQVRYNVDMLNDITILRLREVAMLDQLEAALLERLNAATLASERRAINLRLKRVKRLQAIWCQHNTVNRSKA